MDFFALIPVRNVLEEEEEATTSSQGTIDEEMAMEKQSKKSKKSKKDKKDKKKKKEKKSEKKQKEERRQDADEEGARMHEGPEVQDKRQKVHGDSVPEIIEDSDTFALAKFISDVSEPLARAKKEEKKLFLDFCGGAGDVQRSYLLLDAPPGEDLRDLWAKEEQRRKKQEDKEQQKQEKRAEDLRASLETHKKRRKLSPESSAGNSSSGSSGTPTSPRHWEDQTMQHKKDKEKQECDEEWVERELVQLGIIGGINVGICCMLRPMPGQDKTMYFRNMRSQFCKLYIDLSLRKMFYIGIAADPKHRWGNEECGHVFNFDDMHLLAYGCSTTIGDFEDFLIKHAWLYHGQRCLNQQVGRAGQGTPDQHSYLYICSRDKQPEDDDFDQCYGNASKVRRKFMREQAHEAPVIDSMYD